MFDSTIVVNEFVNFVTKNIAPEFRSWYIRDKKGNTAYNTIHVDFNSFGPSGCKYTKKAYDWAFKIMDTQTRVYIQGLLFDV